MALIYVYYKYLICFSLLSLFSRVTVHNVPPFLDVHLKCSFRRCEQRLPRFGWKINATE